jgi:hypothetical protein
MDLPPLEHHVWLDVISGKIHYQFESLAARILLRTLARSAAEDPSPDNLLNCARMLRGLFVQNSSSPSIQNDLRKICADRKLDAL